MDTDMDRPQVTVAGIDRLRASIDGQVITAADAGYDAARSVFYAAIDRRPAAVVKVANDADVARVVTLAADAGAELAVRSGGHSSAGYGTCDGGIVIDLAGMQGFEADVEGRTAWAQPGLTAGAYSAAAGRFGLATGFGDSPTVGIGGITLGGGLGFLHRAHGLTIDNVIGAEIVTSDGRLLHVDAATHPDLFWAIRGGGGNFGVVTRVQFRLHEVASVVGGMLILPATPETVADCFAAMVAAPEQLSGLFNVMVAPSMPFLPAEYHGKPVIMVALVHSDSGDAGAGERAVAPFRALAKPIVDEIRTLQYAQLFEEHAAPRPPAMAVRSVFLETLDRPAAADVIERLRASTGQMSVVQFRALGGAVARVPADATAFAHRDRAMLAAIAAVHAGDHEAPAHEAWAADTADALRQGEPGAYVGFTTEKGASALPQVYPAATRLRLAGIKARYDPDNLFRGNLNIRPAASAASVELPDA